MEQQICQVLSGVAEHLEKDVFASSGNIIIQGGKGYGKTVLAKAFRLLVRLSSKSLQKPK